MNKKFSEIYEACIEDIKAGLWTKGYDVKKREDGSFCFCARGLIKKHEGIEIIEDDGYYDFALYQVGGMPSLTFAYDKSPVVSIAEYNDAPDRTAEDMIAFFERLRDAAIMEGK